MIKISVVLLFLAFATSNKQRLWADGCVQKTFLHGELG